MNFSDINDKKDFARQDFRAEKDTVKRRMSEIYGDIYRKASSVPSNQIAISIISEESSQINSLIRRLPQELKSGAVKYLSERGLTGGLTEIIWANVMNAAGVPKAELCRTESVDRATVRSGAARTVPAGNGRIESLRKTQVICGGAAAAGVIAEIVTCLIVPGFTGVAAVIKGAELVVIGAGVAGAIGAQKKIEEIDRISASRSAAADRGGSAKNIVSEICKKQCENNTRIILDWIDSVSAQLALQCEKELR